MNPFVEKIAINLVTGVMGSLIPKLAELLKEEYKLKKSVKDGIMSLEKEMKTMHAALRKVAEVPRDQLDDQVKLWAGEVRELSFDMEDIVDKFLVRVDDSSELATNSNKLKRLTEKMAGLFTKGKARHQIADAIKDINKQVQEVSNRRERYTVENIVARPPVVAPIPIDPRLCALYKDVSELVGIAGERDHELMKLLHAEDNETNKKLKIVSVVGFGGLGKTTLVKSVYENIKDDFDCTAFVPIGRNAGVKKILVDILHDLGIYESRFTVLDERQLIDILRGSLMNKRYLIVIDDMWDEKLWRVINCAFSSNNNFGSRLITTTRIVNVSKLCCSSSDDSVYQMEPLSYADSKRLFYKRIFSHERGCPREFKKVSISILKKCGGVPLVIITIGSLLAGDQQVKHVDEWYTLLESIGRGLTEDPSVEEMLRILSFSYYDLPSHLKTCLLYLSVFPEDYKIRIDRLIWMWIAESFVQCGKPGTCLFQIGETYLNELMNRNMIQLVDYEDNMTDQVVPGCRVHDMILDLIVSLSREDNFVTILNGTNDSMYSQSNARRLSLQNTVREELPTRPLESVSILQAVRSIVAFEPAIAEMPPLSNFSVLRVLDLADCDLSGDNHINLRELGSLLHLRYLCLDNTMISQIPKEVGKLQFLQVLILRGNDGIKGLPSTVSKLSRLLCLLTDSYCESFPEGMGNLSSMEVLSYIFVNSPRMVKELGSMERLRELGIQFSDSSLELQEALSQTLGKLSNIQNIDMIGEGEGIQPFDLFGEHWVPPRSLEMFTTDSFIKFSVLPAWIKRNPSHFSRLNRLGIYMDKVRQEDLGVLGRLPALEYLCLWRKRQSGLLAVGATEGFHCLTFLELISSSPGPIVFLPGALPKAEEILLHTSLPVAQDQEASGNGGIGCFELGMENLPSLGKVHVQLHRSGVKVGEARQAQAALTTTLRAHPSRPAFDIMIVPYIPRALREWEGTPRAWNPRLSSRRPSAQSKPRAALGLAPRRTWASAQPQPPSA